MLLNSEAAETFIGIEIDTAELFLRLALDAREDGSRERQLGLARRAYDTARHFLPRTDFPRPVRSGFEKRLAELQARFEGLGQELA